MAGRVAIQVPVLSRLSAAGLVAVGAWLFASGCSENEAAPLTLPPPEALAGRLIEPGDLSGTWTVNAGPDSSVVSASGVVSEADQVNLPKIELCDRASEPSRMAADILRWKAFRQLDLTEQDPISPPGDRSGHQVFVQEFLTSDQPEQTEATFRLLRDGMKACLGDLPASEEGPGRAEAMNLPEVGEDRYGVHITIEEKGGGAQWRLYNALVRRHSELAFITVVDIIAGEGVDPLHSPAEIIEIIETTVGKL